MQEVTLCLPLRLDWDRREVLLGVKRKGFGVGKRNGYGGKIRPRETPPGAAARELLEESGLFVRAEELEHVANIRFYFGDEGHPKFFCYVYLAHAWSGQPKDTEEMHAHQMFPTTNLPLEEMLPADKKWLPLVLRGNKIRACVRYSASGDSVTHFHWEPGLVSAKSSGKR